MSRKKIKFPLDEGHDIEAEWMWAAPLGKDEFILDNSPFHAYGISYQDVFLTKAGEPEFLRILKKSGHRTLRVRFPRGKTHAAFVAIWEPFERLGCTFEGSQVDRPLYAIDVPPLVDLDKIITRLAELEAANVLEYEEADC